MAGSSYFVMTMDRLTRGAVATALAVAMATPVCAQATANPPTPSEPTSAGQSETPSPQSSAPAPATESSSAPAIPTPNLGRIRDALARQPGVNLDVDQLRYYLRVVEKAPAFSDYVKGYDFINGATKGGDPMSHQEFVNMVTPKELHSSAGITATESLQFALTNWLGQALIKKALADIQQAQSEREVDAIRARITQELTALGAAAPK
jgi:hypothetical protein